MGTLEQALESDGNVNILLTPSIITLDNERAGRPAPDRYGEGCQTEAKPIAPKVALSIGVALINRILSWVAS